MPNKKKGGTMMKNLGRLLKIMWKSYPVHFILVILTTAFSTVANVIGSIFLGRLIDFIDTQFMKSATSFSEADFDGLGRMVLVMGLIYLAGLISNYAYQRMTAVMSQGVQKKIRDQLFNQMETLPISYFDRRTHGDIMSVYTNDIDSLREMMSRALPLMLSAIISIVMVFTAMLIQSWLLTIVVMVFFIVELIVMYIITKNSAKPLNLENPDGKLVTYNGKALTVQL